MSNCRQRRPTSIRQQIAATTASISSNEGESEDLAWMSNQHARSAPQMLNWPYRTLLILLVQIAFIASLSLISSYLLLPKLSPTRQGFICNDPSLKLRYHSNTVEFSAIHITGYALVIITILFIECRPLSSWRRPKASLGAASNAAITQNNALAEDEDTTNAVSQHPRAMRAIYVFFASQMGLSLNLFMYYLVKYTTGRLRPHFFDVCQPRVNCTAGEYVDEYTCNGPDAALIEDVFLSFYSGHASTAFFYAGFLITYTQLRLRKRLFHGLPVLFMFHVLLLVTAWCVGSTRVSDNKHHNGDVVFGSIVGALLGASIVLVYLREVLNRLDPPSERHSINTTSLTLEPRSASSLPTTRDLTS